MEDEFSNGYIMVPVKISPQFHKLAKQNNIKFVEAMRTGLSILFAERGLGEYDNRLSIMRRMEKMSKLLEATMAEAEALRAKADIIGV